VSTGTGKEGGAMNKRMILERLTPRTHSALRDPRQRGGRREGVRAFRQHVVVLLTTAGLVAAVAACGGRADERHAVESDTPVTTPRTTGDGSGDWIGFSDAEVGLAGSHPPGWNRARSLTQLLQPREVLALATYPLRGGAEVGECAPSTAREDMPAGGTFIWLVEYLPEDGDAWAEIPRERFPPKPEAFELEPDSLGQNLSCFLGPGYAATFRVGERPFQLLVAFGGEPPAARLDEVESILDSLEFD
jgi:hypothetical protein